MLGGLTVNCFDLLRLSAGGRTESLRKKMVNQLTNHKEAELEKFFNSQQDLPLKEKK